MIQPQKNIQNIVFGIILVLLFFAVCQLFKPFFTVLLWSLLFYVLFKPLHRRVIKNVDAQKRGGRFIINLWAAVFAVATVVVILIPLLFVALQFFKQIIDLLQSIRDTLYTKPELMQEMLESFSKFIADISMGYITITPDEIQRNIIGIVTNSSQSLMQFSSTAVRNVGSFFLGLALMIFCLFFFYIDGLYLSKLFLHIIPIRQDYLNALVAKFVDITRNLFLGYIMVALVQAVIAFIVFSLFHIKGAMVLAALTFICVFIPMIGGGIVWIPLGIVQILSGDMPGGILFMVVSGLSISTLDNFLRPMFLQNRIQLHPLIIFFAILGGLTVFGFNGLIVGPMLVILFLTVLDLFLAE
ncbi:MAG: AI-2E family transporter [Spirochaetaceae bacterium]|jgi:predicted PurR-regulated permease PerM|nr:AI-2E family transporter [Spirochaetaceae bacterium]